MDGDDGLTMNPSRALPAVVFCGLCAAGWAIGAALTPPLPPVPKRNHVSAAVHQGQGAAKLIAKAVLPPAPTTNTIAWQYPPGIDPSARWWNVETSTDLTTWSVLVSNATGEASINVSKSQPLQAFRLSGRLSQ